MNDFTEVSRKEFYSVVGNPYRVQIRTVVGQPITSNYYNKDGDIVGKMVTIGCFFDYFKNERVYSLSNSFMPAKRKREIIKDKSNNGV